MTLEVEPDWFDGFFEREWLDHLALWPGPEWTDRQLALLVGQLGLREGTRVLDLACGRGRIAIPLARRGCRVTGVDLSPNSLELARRDAAAGVELELVRLDMRELAEVERFDVVVNVFSSFGYFADQADDERVLAAVARALVDGGAFLVDTLNPIALAAGFVPVDWHEHEDGTIFLERRWYDHLTGRSEATWTFVRPDGSRSELRHSMRAYTAPELVTMLRAAGLEADAAWGSWDGAPLGDGRRLILRARKSGSGARVH